MPVYSNDTASSRLRALARRGVPPYLYDMPKQQLPEDYCSWPSMVTAVDELLAGRTIKLPKFRFVDAWLLFLRIQKTASTTLSSVLRKMVHSACNGSHVCPWGCENEPKEWPEAARCMLRCPDCRLLVERHYDYDQLMKPFQMKPVFAADPAYPVKDYEPRILTLLREPVARAHSELNHILTHGDWTCLKGTVDYVTVEYLTGDATKCGGGWNRQTKMIAGFSGWKSRTPWNETIQSEEDLLRMAADHLLEETTGFVGISTEVDASINMLAYTMNIRLPKSYQYRYNVPKETSQDGKQRLKPMTGEQSTDGNGPSKPITQTRRRSLSEMPENAEKLPKEKISALVKSQALTSDQLFSILYERNQLDMRLYCLAKRIFEERMKILTTKRYIYEYACGESKVRGPYVQRTCRRVSRWEDKGANSSQVG